MDYKGQRIEGVHHGAGGGKGSAKRMCGVHREWRKRG